MQLPLGVIWISMVARNKMKVFPGDLHLNTYAQKHLDLSKLANLALNDNQNRVTTCYQIAIHNNTFICSEKVLDDLASNHSKLEANLPCTNSLSFILTWLNKLIIFGLFCCLTCHYVDCHLR